MKYKITWRCASPCAMSKKCSSSALYASLGESEYDQTCHKYDIHRPHCTGKIRITHHEELFAQIVVKVTHLYLDMKVWSDGTSSLPAWWNRTALWGWKYTFQSQICLFTAGGLNDSDCVEFYGNSNSTWTFPPCIIPRRPKTSILWS